MASAGVDVGRAQGVQRDHDARPIAHELASRTDRPFLAHGLPLDDAMAVLVAELGVLPLLVSEAVGSVADAAAK